MCLSIEVKRPKCVLSKGEHAGFQFVTVHNGMGYRCGYVRVPKGHPWHGKNEDEIECAVHGGLTFGEHDVPCEKGGPDDAHWFGFDCAHSGDMQDPELPAELPRYTTRMFDDRGTIRTQEYVEAECRKLCEQAKEAT